MKLRFSRFPVFAVLVFMGIALFTRCKTVPAPLFTDPNYYGSCDPEIIYNPGDKAWYIYYTSRRSLIEENFVATPIGVLKSTDMRHWQFMGYCKFDGIGGNKDMPSTFWAPAMIAKGDQLHMFVTWKPDTNTQRGAWGGPSKIVHYVAPQNNPINGWTKVADMHGDEYDALDATVFEKADTFHVWFKAKPANAKKNQLFHLESTDMKTWKNCGFSQSDVFNAKASGSDFEEAPYIFNWKGSYWLITDPHKGLFVYKSSDAEHWKFQGTILETPGSRKNDNSMARHCSVIVQNDRAFIIYHVEPWRDYTSGMPVYKQPTDNRRSVLQMAELKLVDGQLVCDRNATIR